MIHRSPFADVSIPRQSLTEFVLGSGRGQPQNPALVDGVTGRVVTYGELREQVRRVAAGLAELGIRKGDVVALWSPNSPEFAIAFHAVACLGAILTTANPALTPHEMSQQLGDAGARILITTDALVDKARVALAEVHPAIELITVEPVPGVKSLASIMRDADPPAVSIDPDNDLVVLPYSSGTTGLPKGVMLTHRNLVANLVQILSVDGIQPHAMVAVLPFFHIYGMVCILNQGLRQGAAIVTMPRFELESYLKVLQDWRIEYSHIVPPIAVALAKHPSVSDYDLSSVKSLFSGAAPLGASVSNAVQRRLNITIRQGYGLTEASPATHISSLSGECRAGKVGQLVPCTECRIVDVVCGKDAAPGEPGEVWIRGPQVMKGYLNNPAATASTLDAEGWLHTGDIGSVDADGFLEIVDRLKELIKVKGCQVAPAELEALLLTHPHIADVAVVPVPDDESGEVPKAFVVPRGELTEEDVMAFVRTQVAHFKRIRYVAFIDAIPKSASGKILRRVLVERDRAERVEVAS